MTLAPPVAPAAQPLSFIGRLRQIPLVRRITGYSAGSVVAAATSELAFASVLYWGHRGTALASAAGFVGGAIPNYYLNRRWAWSDRRGRDRRIEVLLYAAVSLATFAVATVVTGAVEHWAKQLTTARGSQVLLTAAAYLAVSGAFFVAKFVLYELVVFTKGPGGVAASGERLPVAPTR